MAEFEDVILLDVMVVSLIALGFGIVVHAFLRRRNPEKAWGRRGNVWTQPFGGLDLPVLFFLLGLFLFSVWSHGAGDEGATADDGGIGLQEAWFGVVFYVFLVSSLLFFLGVIRMANIVEMFGLARQPPWKIGLIAILAMFVTYPMIYLAAQAAMALTGDSFAGLERQKEVRILAETSDPALRIVLILSACVIAPVAEEFLFRGYIYAVVKRFTDTAFSAIFTSLVFATVHMNLLGFVPLLVLAMCFTLAYELTGCLWIPIAMHAIFNAVTVALVFLAPDIL